MDKMDKVNYKMYEYFITIEPMNGIHSVKI